MSEQATMTREQLEAAGWDIYIGEQDYYEFIGHAPDGMSVCSDDKDHFYQTCTAHYRQQQELFNFREFLHDIDGLLDKLAFYSNNHDALDDLQILRDSINIPNTWHGDAGTWNPPTVSESERAE